MSKADEYAIELLKCKKSIFYFMYNYCKVPEVGGALQLTPSHVSPKMVETVKATIKYHRTMLMASRQLGKSTMAAIMIEWVANLFPGSQAVIINANKSMALENLNKVRFIHQHLPGFLQTPSKGTERKTYMEYENGSVVKTFYPSTTTSPDLLARSLTVPVVYLDESAFVPHMAEIYGSAQPTLSTAREQAIKNGYPYFLLVTSTPNGSTGTGKWFFDMWANALSSEQIFTSDHKFESNIDNIVNSPSNNAFIRVRFHWSDVKSQEWYDQQCRELNFNKRQINQEMDLLFTGTIGCIFDDAFLSNLKPTPPKNIVNLPSLGKLNVYVNELDAGDYYIIGVDSAKSITGDYCAIEVVKYSTLEQVAEYYERVGSISKFAKNIMTVVDWVTDIVGNRYVLAIENNNVGSGVIEDLENAPKDYIGQMYNSNDRRGYGINTNVSTKDKMISYLYDYITPNPSYLHSIEIINQLSVIEKKGNGSVAAQSGQHDDLFMAYALTAYAKKMTLMDIEPRLNPEISKKLDKEEVQFVQNVIGPSLLDPASSFTDMVSSMSDMDLSAMGNAVKDEELEVGDMSRVINDIFGG